MSKRKHYPPFCTVGASYPFVQADSVVLNYFNDAMKVVGSTKKEVVFPLYVGIHNSLVKSRAKPKNALDMALALPPAEFLLQYEAFCLNSTDDSGFANGLILYSFLAGIRAATGLKYALVINPPITFGQALRTASVPASYHITCLYDEQTASIYQMDGSLQSFRVSTLKTFNREKTYNNVLIFHHSSSVSELKPLLQDLFPCGLPPQCKLHIVVPTSFLGGHPTKALRNYLATDLPLRHILVVDPRATNVAPSKRCVLTFYGIGDEVYIQRARLSHNKVLHTGPNHIISSDLFINTAKPLHQLCADLEQSNFATRAREPARQFAISKHVVLMYRVERQRGDKFRVIAYYTSKGTPSQQRKNISSRGARISKFFRSGSMSSPDEIDPFLLKLMWDDDLSKIIREDIRDNIDLSALDLPTLWYLHQQDLLKQEIYQHNACISFFRSLSPTDSLYSMTLSSSQELVHTALADYAQKYSLSGNQQRRLIIQLRLIWNQAYMKKYCSSNPFSEIMAANERKKHERSSLTESSALRAIEQDCLDRLEVFLIMRNDIALNALISLKRHTGLPSSEIGALNWEDLIHVTNMDFDVLMVSKRLPVSGTTPVSFGAVEQNRIVPIPHIATEIHKYRLFEKKLAKNEGITDKDFMKGPMFHALNDRKKRLSKNGINKMLKQARDSLGIEQQCVPLPNGNGVMQYDVNQYGGDIFRAFYDVRIRASASFADDCAYLYGTRLHSVACRHYRDYWHPTTQLMLYQIQNRCANLQGGGEKVSTTQHSFTVDPSNGQSLVVPTSSVRTQTVITIAIPPNSNLSTLCAHIKCRFGMDITISYHHNS